MVQPGLTLDRRRLAGPRRSGKGAAWRLSHVFAALEHRCAGASAETHASGIRPLQRFCIFTTSDAVEFAA
jgi:hypothetical protein